MTKREKVIKGLECCILRDPDDHARCSQCSYGSNCVNRLKMDALELLKGKDTNVLTKWISVKDRVPDLDGEYLCWFGDYPMGAHYRICRYTNSKGFYCYTDNFKWHFITHWMPLPEPPKEGDEK